MDIRIQKIETFGAGVKAFRVVPVGNPGREASAPESGGVKGSGVAQGGNVTESAKGFGDFLRAKIPQRRAAN
jgi:hypothetical protein